MIKIIESIRKEIKKSNLPQTAKRDWRDRLNEVKTKV
jgi:hypothetical protein